MAGIEDKFRDLVKQIGQEKRLGDKRAEQFYVQGIGTKFKMRAYSNLEQTITTATLTICNLDTENFDPGADFNITTYQYTVPLTGYYIITGQVFWKAAVADKSYSGYLHYNGLPIQQSLAHQSYIDAVTCSMATVYYCVAGNVIELKCWQNSGGNAVVDNGSQKTFLSVHLLSI